MLADSNPKEFWDLVNSIKSKRSGISDKIPPDEWFNYFCKLNEINFLYENTSTESQIVKDVEIWVTCHVENLDKLISFEETQNVTKKLKSNKASTTDSINHEIIKVSSNNLAYYHEKQFNRILADGMFTKTWSVGLITPLYKPGNRTDPGNYRGIRLSSCLGKFFTTILNTRLNQ